MTLYISCWFVVALRVYQIYNKDVLARHQTRLNSHDIQTEGNVQWYTFEIVNAPAKQQTNNFYVHLFLRLIYHTYCTHAHTHAHTHSHTQHKGKSNWVLSSLANNSFFLNRINCTLIAQNLFLVQRRKSPKLAVGFDEWIDEIGITKMLKADYFQWYRLTNVAV